MFFRIILLLFIALSLYANQKDKKDYNLDMGYDSWYIWNKNGKAGLLKGFSTSYIKDDGSSFTLRFYDGDIRLIDSDNTKYKSNSHKRYYYLTYKFIPKDKELFKFITTSNHYDYLSFGLNFLDERNIYESKVPNWLYNKTGTKYFYENFKIYNLFYGETYIFKLTKKLTFIQELSINYSLVEIYYLNTKINEINFRREYKKGLGSRSLLKYTLNKKLYLQAGIQYEIYDKNYKKAIHYDDIGLQFKIGFIF